VICNMPRHKCFLAVAVLATAKHPTGINASSSLRASLGAKRPGIRGRITGRIPQGGVCSRRRRKSGGSLEN